MYLVALLAGGVLLFSLARLAEVIGGNSALALMRSLLNRNQESSASRQKTPVTIDVIRSDGEVVTLPPLRPDDAASIRIFIREAEKATGEHIHAT
jgi:hypothetical protein